LRMKVVKVLSSMSCLALSCSVNNLLDTRHVIASQSLVNPRFVARQG
jgi:hypothetical protein